MKPSIRRVAQLKSYEDFQSHLAIIGASIPCSPQIETLGPLSTSFSVDGRTLSNRFCILPMEGWDATTDGHPSELTLRRWSRFGESGAKWIWGGEAFAVQADGRANPNQLMITADHRESAKQLLHTLKSSHRKIYGTVDDLLVGLQLTHSGRFARPTSKTKIEAKTLYRHPILDSRFGLPALHTCISDAYIDELVSSFVDGASNAHDAGFDFVDIKHCHGYLGHEFLSAYDRPGRYGGSFENRTRFICSIIEGIRRNTPNLAIGVRLSAFDYAPFRRGSEGIGVPQLAEDNSTTYRYAFGGDGSGTGIDLNETIDFLKLLVDRGVLMVCVTVGSPYYNPHIQRPALFPPSDGYEPPEDPLVGVARQIEVTRRLKLAVPQIVFVGSGYSYLQDWLPNVAQEVIATGAADAIGLGRMVLSYPTLPADVLSGKPLQRKLVCRTFSDCTTAPRNGLVSGCYPLDSFYKDRPEYAELVKLKLKK